MFGFIRANKPELKVKELEMYKAVYCTLCKDMGKTYGMFSRFTLSYDFTFLALLNLSLKDGCDTVERKCCTFNPLKKCNYCKDRVGFKMPSAAAMIMSYYKLKDNIADEKGIKRWGYCLLLPLFKVAHKKAVKLYPNIEEIIAKYIKDQNMLEKGGCDSLDAAADPTAKALAEILKLCSENNTQKRILERLGYCMGRYIYILDAACDLEEDLKKNRYNVLKNNFNGKYGEFVKTKVVPQLYFCSNEAGKAFELLDVKKYKNILGNIIYLGLEDTFKKELNL